MISAAPPDVEEQRVLRSCGDRSRAAGLAACLTLVALGMPQSPAHADPGWVPTADTDIGGHVVAFPDGRGLVLPQPGVYEPMGVRITDNPRRALLRTTDYGRSWSEVPHDHDTPAFLPLVFATPEIGYGVEFMTAADLYRTDDGGESWTPTTPLPLQGRAVGLHAAPDGRTVVATRLALCEDRRNGTPVMQSRDGGRTWQTAWLRGNGLVRHAQFFDVRHGVMVGQVQDGDVKDRCKRPWQERIWYTSDGGRSYRVVQDRAQVDADALLAIEMIGPSRILTVRRSGEISLSTNGGRSFRKVTTVAVPTPTRRPPYTADVDFATPRIGYLAFDGSLWRTSDGGESWTAETALPSTSTYATASIAAFDTERVVATATNTLVQTRFPSLP